MAMIRPKHRLPEVISPQKAASTPAGLPAPAAVLDAVEVFRVLASPIRLRITHALAHHELTFGDLARAMDLSLSVTSHQLACCAG